jgi:hypothetical protein
LPQPELPWRLRIDSAHPDASERSLGESALELPGLSVMLLSAAPRQDST